MRFFPLLFALALFGCDSDDDSDGGGGDANAAAACRTFVSTFADALIRTCEGATEADRPAVESQINGSLPAGGCSGADSIRDKASFENDCLPGIRAVTECPTTAEQLPASCRAQIQYRQ